MKKMIFMLSVLLTGSVLVFSSDKLRCMPVVASAAPALACRPIIMDGITIETIERSEKQVRLEILCDERKNLKNILQYFSIIIPQEVSDQQGTAIRAHDAYALMVSTDRLKGLPYTCISSLENDFRMKIGLEASNSFIELVIEAHNKKPCRSMKAGQLKLGESIPVDTAEQNSWAQKIDTTTAAASAVLKTIIIGYELVRAHCDAKQANNGKCCIQ